MMFEKSLLRDTEKIHRTSMQSLFESFENLCEGTVIVDREARIVWINERYATKLGASSAADAIGKEVEEVIPNSLMRTIVNTGEPILLDLMETPGATFVVMRIPIKDRAGAVIGAAGFALFDQVQSLKPLFARFEAMQRDVMMAQKRLAEERRPKYTFSNFIGSSPVCMELKRQARRAAQREATVLLLGETGTGKELLAHAIHAASARARGPFISVNIAAVPDTLLEAEFFGVAPGAYTGADRKGREGKFSLADGGTLFLDEIGDMPQALQAKLLRALQEGEIEPLGSNKLIPFDARVIAATLRDLAVLVREGKFREDLFYRLNVLPVRVPPLRERRSDIPALLEVLGEEMALRSGDRQPELSPDALALLSAQTWRGNIRELRNVLEQSAMRSDSASIGRAQVEEVLKESGIERIAPALPAADASASASDPLRPLAEQVAELESRAIAAAMEATGGNKLAASRMLGISRAKLYERLDNPDRK
jgi:transcriptional regulator with PAS, ATPase and Fis domain